MINLKQLLIAIAQNIKTLNDKIESIVDSTLSQENKAADAKVTGDTFADLERKTALDIITNTASGKIAHF